MSYKHGNLVDLRVVSQYVFDAVINCAALGSNTVVVNSGTKHIVVLQYVLDCAVPGNTVTWEDSAGILHSGPMPFSETGGLVAPFSEVGHFMLAEGRSLVMNLTAAAQVGGHLSYALI